MKSKLIVQELRIPTEKEDATYNWFEIPSLFTVVFKKGRKYSFMCNRSLTFSKYCKFRNLLHRTCSKCCLFVERKS